MTPKEKADELIKKFFEPVRWKLGQENVTQRAKQCALIAVDEIVKSEPRTPNDVDWDDVGATHQYYYEAQMEEALKFWTEVKQEIEKIGGQDE